MGQIQNAVLNALGSVQQMAQLYKLSDTYIKQQTKRSAEAARVAAEEQEKQKYEQAEKERIKSRTAEQAKADILATPLTEEENKKFSETYNYAKDYTPQQLKDPRSKLDRSIRLYAGEFTDPEYVALIREREWFRQNHPTAAERDEMDKRAKALKSAQEQANTNKNIAKAKNTARGGKK